MPLDQSAAVGVTALRPPWTIRIVPQKWAWLMSRLGPLSLASPPVFQKRCLTIWNMPLITKNTCTINQPLDFTLYCCIISFIALCWRFHSLQQFCRCLFLLFDRHRNKHCFLAYTHVSPIEHMNRMHCETRFYSTERSHWIPVSCSHSIHRTVRRFYRNTI